MASAGLISLANLVHVCAKSPRSLEGYVILGYHQVIVAQHGIPPAAYEARLQLVQGPEQLELQRVPVPVPPTTIADQSR
ncbi:hypothetical protein CCR75_007959 [Bremia lactucae]|uniref:Uncharacterized protein n=1 Tax=Bremia lactucae TaxID=4779 RepID=A0A976FLP9_BRELC|nr:hypothetical protein CCR75_007959 [Bremia lactucae]